MDKEEYLNRLHQEILVVMDEVARICEKHNLRYYLIGGTLLGAVRHRGFIPWDDDLDIIMPRTDYEKFMKIAPTELNEQYELQWISTNPEYWLQFAKVCNKRTLFDEESYHQVGKSFGIFVDILVMDTTKGYCRSVVLRKTLIKKTMIMMRWKQGISAPKQGIKGFINKVIKVIPMRWLHWMMDALMQMSNQGGGKYYTSFSSQYNVKRETSHHDHFGEGKFAAFEDRQYMIPVEPEAVLTAIFGPDYMQLPPEEKRRTHCPVKVIFSDGVTAEFGETEPRIYAEADL